MMNIHTDATYMMDLLARVKSGSAVPAPFQRPFVWGKDDVLALWTSIIKGYPLGSFLLWLPKGGSHFKSTSLGPIEFVPTPHSELILDGQNRMVTIAWSMTPPDADVHEDASGASIFRDGQVLVLDPHQKKPLFLDPDEVTGLIMPVHYLFNRFSKFLRDQWRSDEDDEAIEWLDHVGSMLREARITITHMENATIDEARDAFLHIARAGVPMSQEDFDNALASGSGQ